MSVDYSDVQMCESYVHFLPHTRERERREQEREKEKNASYH